MKRQLGFLAAAAALSLAVQANAIGAEWKIDPSHSEVRFSVRHMLISNVAGNFGKVTGKVSYDGKNLARASVESDIDAASIDTRDAKRDEHLKGADFLDAAQFPGITFRSRKIRLRKGGRFDIEGDLSLHGVTKTVVLHADPVTQVIKDPHGGKRFGAFARATINRGDFGIKFNKTLDNGGAIVGDEVRVELNMEMKQ